MTCGLTLCHLLGDPWGPGTFWIWTQADECQGRSPCVGVDSEGPASLFSILWKKGAEANRRMHSNLWNLSHNHLSLDSRNKLNLLHADTCLSAFISMLIFDLTASSFAINKSHHRKGKWSCFIFHPSFYSQHVLLTILKRIKPKHTVNSCHVLSMGPADVLSTCPWNLKEPLCGHSKTLNTYGTDRYVQPLSFQHCLELMCHEKQ